LLLIYYCDVFLIKFSLLCHVHQLPQKLIH
jgi:hypothetical protein